MLKGPRVGGAHLVLSGRRGVTRAFLVLSEGQDPAFRLHGDSLFRCCVLGCGQQQLRQGTIGALIASAAAELWGRIHLLNTFYPEI